jgi:Thioesterase-like superfamily
MSTPAAIFHRDGNRFIPTELARGPWSPDAQHGGAPAALVAHAVEEVEPGPTFVARVTLELVRPVPLTPLTVETELLRPGKRVQVVEATVKGGDDVVVRARGVRIRTAQLDLPTTEVEPIPSHVAAPAAASPLEIQPFSMSDVGFWRALEFRLAAGTWGEPGPAAMWFRLAVPIIDGEEPSPLMRVAAAADFGNGISTPFERGRYLFINPDLTFTIYRQPVGEWVLLDAVTHAEPSGVGVADGALYDEQGRIGRAVQTLLLDRL